MRSVVWRTLAVFVLLSRQPSADSRTVTNLTVFEQTVTWNDALEACRVSGGRLAEPRDAPTDNALLGVVESIGNSLHIGIFRLDAFVGDTLWVTSCDLPTYTNWYTGTINALDTKYCGRFNEKDLAWKRGLCSRPRMYVCEYLTDTPCTYEVILQTSVDLTLPNTEVLSITYQLSSDECATRCETELSSSGMECWAINVLSSLKECSLLLTSDPFIAEDPSHQITSSGDLFIRNCFNQLDGDPIDLGRPPDTSVKANVDCPEPASSPTESVTSGEPTQTLGNGEAYMYEASFPTPMNGAITDTSFPTPTNGTIADTSFPTQTNGTIADTSFPTQTNGTIADTSFPTQTNGTIADTSFPTQTNGTIADTSFPTQTNGTIADTSFPTPTNGTIADTSFPTQTNGTIADTSFPTQTNGTIADTSFPTQTNGTIADTSFPTQTNGTIADTLFPTPTNGTIADTSFPTPTNGTIADTSFPTPTNGTIADTSFPTPTNGAIADTSFPTPTNGAIKATSSQTPTNGTIAETASVHKASTGVRSTTIYSDHSSPVQSGTTSTSPWLSIDASSSPGVDNDAKTELTSIQTVENEISPKSGGWSFHLNEVSAQRTAAELSSMMDNSFGNDKPMTHSFQDGTGGVAHAAYGSSTAQLYEEVSATSLTRYFVPSLTTFPNAANSIPTYLWTGKCVCEVRTPVDRQLFLANLLATLTVDKSAVSSWRRRYRTAADDRLLCLAIGIPAMVLLVAVYLAMVAADVHNFSRRYNDYRKYSIGRRNIPCEHKI